MIYEIKNIDFSYDNNHKVLNDISFDITEKEIVTILGKNGAGKTTLFSCMLKLLKTQKGEILLDSRNINELSEKEITAIVSYVPQTTNQTFDFTVYEYVLMGASSDIGLFQRPLKAHEKMAYDALQTLDLLELIDRPISTLSGGERQKAAIARAIASNPKIIIFDEPTAHLDYSNQIKVLKLIKDLNKKGYAVVISTHDPNHAILLEGSVVLMDNEGRVSKGNFEGMISEDRLNKVYGTDLKIRYLDEFKRKICVYPSI